MNDTSTNVNNDSGSEQDRWKAMANEKYGTDVVKATSHLYRERYEDMMQDDNILGAIPTLTFEPNISCPWRRNKPNYCFVCVLVELKFYREDNELRLYLDARGETDLRNPQDSSIVRRDSSTKDEDVSAASASSFSASSPLAFFNEDISTLISGQFVSEISVPGHYKGYLSFDAGVFAKKGKYYFTFADVRRNPSFRRMMARMEARGAPASSLAMPKDYPDTFLLEVPEDQGLAQAFIRKEGGKTHYTAVSSSPFEHDTNAKELQRFAPFVDPAVLTRHEEEEESLDRDSTEATASGSSGEKKAPKRKNTRKWWIGPNDTLDTTPVPQRVLLHVPGSKKGGVMLNLK